MPLDKQLEDLFNSMSPEEQAQAMELLKIDEAEKPSILESIGAGASQGGSLGWADELEGYSVAIGKKLRGDPRPYSEIAEEATQKSRDYYNAAKKENPKSFGASEIAGMVASPINKLTGGLAKSAPITTSAAEGAVAGAGMADEDKLLGAGVGGAFGAVGGAAGKGISKLFGKAGEKLAKRKATEALSPTARQEAKILAGAKSSKEIDKQFESIGEELLNRDIIRMNKEDMYGRLLDENTLVGKEIQSVHQTLDDAIGRPIISRNEVAMSLEKEAKKASSKALKGQVSRKEALQKAAKLQRDFAKESGDKISFSEALTEKHLAGLDAYQSSPKFSASPSPIDEYASRTIERNLAKQIRKKAAKVSPELADRLRQANQTFGQLQKAGDILQSSVGRNSSFQTLQNLTVGSAVAISHHPLAGVGATLGREAMRKYGKAGVALTANKLSQLPSSEAISQVIQGAGRSSGRFGPLLGKNLEE